MGSRVLSEGRRLRFGIFFALYVMQGIPAGFALTALTNYMTAEGIGPERVGGFAAAVGLPWAFQFAWGPLIDRFQGSRMGRRRPWLMATQLLAFLASLGVVLAGDPVGRLDLLTLALFVHSVFASVQDASADAMAISVIPDSERGRVNAFMRGGFLFGAGAGAAVLSQVLRHSGFAAAALVQSGLLLALTVPTFLVRERPGDLAWPWSRRRGDVEIDPRPGRAGGPAGPTELKLGRIFVELASAMLAPRNLRLFAAIAVVSTSGSVFVRAFSMHLIRDLGWTDTGLSTFSGTYGTFGALVAIVAGGTLSDWIGHRRMLGLVMLGMSCFLFGFCGLGAWWARPGVAQVGLILWSTFDPAFSVAAMPVLMAVCRRGIEGSQFTAYMAFVNLCDIAGSYLAGHALGFAPAPAIGLGCGVAVLLALGAILREIPAPAVAPIEPIPARPD